MKFSTTTMLLPNEKLDSDSNHNYHTETQDFSNYLCT